MKSEWRLFGIVSFFLAIVAVIYGLWTHGADGRVEWIGLVALILSFLLTAMCGGFFWFVSRRIDPRPEDRPDGEIADGAGEVGFFSPGSYWPFGIALAASVAGLGLVFWQWWLIAAGLVAVVFAACGLLFEYYSGTRRTAEH
ncbi:cytochrome c oxidase subunit 4 [Plantactinospora sonchi]|uniref:Cytochrome c oxidase polypeptide 4 n=1 Tax=Plantactinospora sonchi TaxID=1544735 RepID=A0ABU7RVJ4_9ACTN